MAQQVLGALTDTGDTLMLQENALRTEDSLVALNHVTQIKCIDDTRQVPFPWILILVLVAAGIASIACMEFSGFLIIPALGCFIGVGCAINDYLKKKKIRTYALIIELSSGSGLSYHSEDIEFLNEVKNTIFDAVQNGAARVSYIDLSQKKIKIENSVITGRDVNRPININSKNKNKYREENNMIYSPNTTDSIIAGRDVNKVRKKSDYSDSTSTTIIDSPSSVSVIDWNRLSDEVNKLNSQQLSPSARDFATIMKHACENKDESKVKKVCLKLGGYVLTLAESLGLELIVSLIKECIMR